MHHRLKCRTTKLYFLGKKNGIKPQRIQDSSKVQTIKGEIDKFYFIKIKNFCSEEDPGKRMKRQAKKQEKKM